jgi:hypothetical protein
MISDTEHFEVIICKTLDQVAVSKLIVEFIKSVIFLKNLIPAPYDALVHRVESCCNLNSFQQKKVDRFISTFSRIERDIMSIGRDVTIRAVRVLFGPVPSCPREIFMMNIDRSCEFSSNSSSVLYESSNFSVAYRKLCRALFNYSYTLNSTEACMLSRYGAYIELSIERANTALITDYFKPVQVRLKNNCPKNKSHIFSLVLNSSSVPSFDDKMTYRSKLFLKSLKIKVK